MDYQDEMVVIDRFDIRVFLEGRTMVMQSFAGAGVSYVEEDPYFCSTCRVQCVHWRNPP